MSLLTVELPDELIARLAAESEFRRISQAAIVETALTQVLPSESPAIGESLAAKMKDLIGCFDSGVTDLATNPKHLEGFGQWRR